MAKKKDEVIVEMAAPPATIPIPYTDPSIINTAPVPEPRISPTWEPPHVHVRKVKFDYVKLEPVGDTWEVVVGLTSADDARLFYSSIHAHVDYPGVKKPIESLGL